MSPPSRTRCGSSWSWRSWDRLLRGHPLVQHRARRRGATALALVVGVRAVTRSPGTACTARRRALPPVDAAQEARTGCGRTLPRGGYMASRAPADRLPIGISSPASCSRRCRCVPAGARRPLTLVGDGITVFWNDGSTSTFKVTVSTDPTKRLGRPALAVLLVGSISVALVGGVSAGARTHSGRVELGLLCSQPVPGPWRPSSLPSCASG